MNMESPSTHSRKANKAATLPTGSSLQQSHSFSHKDGILKKLKRRFRFGSRGHYEFDEMNEKSVVVKSFTKHDHNDAPSFHLTPDTGRCMLNRSNPRTKVLNGEGDRTKHLNNISENSPKMSTQRPQSVQECRRKWDHHYESVTPKSYSSSSKLNDSKNLDCCSENAKSFLTVENTIYLQNSYVLQDSSAIDLDGESAAFDDDEPGYESLDDVRNKVQQLRSNSAKEKGSSESTKKIVNGTLLETYVSNGINSDVPSNNAIGIQRMKSFPGEHATNSLDHGIGVREKVIVSDIQMSSRSHQYDDFGENSFYQNSDRPDMSVHASENCNKLTLSKNNESTAVCERQTDYFKSDEFDPYENPDNFDLPSRKVTNFPVEGTSCLDHSSAINRNISTFTSDSTFHSRLRPHDIDPYQNPDELEIPATNAGNPNIASQSSHLTFSSRLLPIDFDPYQNPDDLEIPARNTLLEQPVDLSKRDSSAVSVDGAFPSLEKDITDMYANPQQVLIKKHSMKESRKYVPGSSDRESDTPSESITATDDVKEPNSEFADSSFWLYDVPSNCTLSDNEAIAPPLPDRNYIEKADTVINDKLDYPPSKYRSDYEEVILPTLSEPTHVSVVKERKEDVIPLSLIVTSDQNVLEQDISDHQVANSIPVLESDFHAPQNDNNSELLTFLSSSIEHENFDLEQVLDHDIPVQRLQISDTDDSFEMPSIQSNGFEVHSPTVQIPDNRSPKQNILKDDHSNHVVTHQDHESIKQITPSSPQDIHCKNEHGTDQHSQFEDLMAELLQGDSQSKVSELTENTLTPYNPFDTQHSTTHLLMQDSSGETRGVSVDTCVTDSDRTDNEIRTTSIPTIGANLYDNLSIEDRIIPESGQKIHSEPCALIFQPADLETGIDHSVETPSASQKNSQGHVESSSNCTNIQPVVVVHDCTEVELNSSKKSGGDSINSRPEVILPSGLPTHSPLGIGDDTELQDHDRSETNCFLLSPATSSSGGSETLQSDSLTLSLTSSATGSSLDSPASPFKISTHDQTDSQINSMILSQSDSLGSGAANATQDLQVGDGHIMFEEEYEDEPIHMTLDEVRGMMHSGNPGDENSSQPPLPPRRPRRSLDRAESGSKNKDFLESMQQLKDCGWYWGPISWEEANMLLAYKPDGSFLVRDSSDPHYILSLSFRHQGTTAHTRIEHHKGMFSFYSQPTSHGRNTIKEFIDQTVENSKTGKFCYFVRPNGPGLPPMPVHIINPVSRFCKIQSLQHMCRFNILKLTRRDHIENLPLPKKIQGYLKDSQYYVENLEDS